MSRESRKQMIAGILLFSVGAIGLVYVRAFLPDDLRHFRVGGGILAVALMAGGWFLWNDKRS